MGQSTQSCSHLSDEQLLVQAQRGQETAFAELFHRHNGRIFRFVNHLCGSLTVAEDVTQEVFLSLLAELRLFDPAKGALLPYLLGIARNLAYRGLRKEQPFLPLDDGLGEDPFDPASDSEDVLSQLGRFETLETLRAAIVALPPVYREVVVLCDLEEMDYAQAAQTIGCAIGTVRSRLHRARNLLIQKWERTAKSGLLAAPAVAGRKTRVLASSDIASDGLMEE